MALAISIKFAKRVFLVANSRSIAGIISHLEVREFFRVFRAKFGHSDTYLKKNSQARLRLRIVKGSNVSLT